MLVIGALAVGLVGGLATGAISDVARFGPGVGWYGGGPGSAMMYAHMGHMGGWRSSATAEERAERMVRHLAVEIDATDEQRERLTEIVVDTLNDLRPMHEQMHLVPQEARTLLTAGTIDRQAIESFRAEQIELADTASRRLAEALGEAAEVLTPEQRAELGSLMEHFGERHGRRHRH